MLACGAGIILAGESSVFSLQTLRPPSFILMVAEGWEERGGKKFVSRGWSCPFPTPTVVSNSKSNMVGWINNHELITLAQPNMMPVLQADIK